MKTCLLVSVFAILSGTANAQTAELDISSYGAVYIKVTTPTDGNYSRQAQHLTALLVGMMRGTEQFEFVDELSDNARRGILLQIDIENIRVVGGARRFFGGALAGKDRLSGTVSYTDMENGRILGETTIGGSGTAGFIHNFGGANIYAALSNFSESLLAWSGLSPSGLGGPQNWNGRVSLKMPVATRCAGMNEKKDHFETAKWVNYWDQDNASLCAALAENLQAAGYLVDQASSQILSVTVEDNAGGQTLHDGAILGRWQLLVSGDTVLEDSFLTIVPATGKRKKHLRASSAAVVQLHAKVGVSALAGIE